MTRRTRTTTKPAARSRTPPSGAKPWKDFRGSHAPSAGRPPGHDGRAAFTRKAEAMSDGHRKLADDWREALARWDGVGADRFERIAQLVQHMGGAAVEKALAALDADIDKLRDALREDQWTYPWPASNETLMGWGNLQSHHRSMTTGAGRAAWLGRPFVLDSVVTDDATGHIADVFTADGSPQCIGRYLSIRTTADQDLTVPPKYVPYGIPRRHGGILESGWPTDAARQFVDWRSQTLAKAAALFAVFDTLARSGFSFIRWDNCTYGYGKRPAGDPASSAPRELSEEQDSASQLALLVECALIGRPLGLPQVVNLSSPAVPVAACDTLNTVVDGYCFEQFPTRTHGQPAFHWLVGEWLALWRKLLDAEKLVAIIPPPVAESANVEAVKRRNQFVAGLAMMIREPGDPLWVLPRLWNGWTRESLPEWESWPRLAGAPRGTYVKRTAGLFSREFENMTIDVNLYEQVAAAA